MSVEEVLVLTIINPKDVVVKVIGTTICGSDLHIYHKKYVSWPSEAGRRRLMQHGITELKDGDILGHEFMAIVDEVGPEVVRLDKGGRVVASFHIATPSIVTGVRVLKLSRCGECKMCRAGLSSMCDTTNKSTNHLPASSAILVCSVLSPPACAQNGYFPGLEKQIISMHTDYS